MLPAIEFSHHRATAAPHHNASTPMSIPGFHFEAHAPQQLLQPEHRQADVPAAQFPSIRRSQCPNCGHFMQEWCANVANRSSGPLYQGIPVTSNKTFHGNVTPGFPSTPHLGNARTTEEFCEGSAHCFNCLSGNLDLVAKKNWLSGE